MKSRASPQYLQLIPHRAGSLTSPRASGSRRYHVVEDTAAIVSAAFGLRTSIVTATGAREPGPNVCATFPARSVLLVTFEYCPANLVHEIELNSLTRQARHP